MTINTTLPDGSAVSLTRVGGTRRRPVYRGTVVRPDGRVGHGGDARGALECLAALVELGAR